jgi:hypothetical protein
MFIMAYNVAKTFGIARNREPVAIAVPALA